MAIGFGFSVSDICMGLKIVRDSIDAFDIKKGASADFANLTLEIQSLQAGLDSVHDLIENGKLQRKQEVALDRALRACHRTIEDFLNSISKYQPHLQNETSGFASRFRKVKWAVCKKDDVKEFQTQLARHAASISMLLITFQTQYHQDLAKSNEVDGTVAVVEQAQDERLLNMLSSMSLENRHCFMMIMQQNNELMQTVQDMRRVLLIQSRTPPQVLLQRPVSLLDPFGRIAPFHLEFVESPECFIAVLKARFAHSGVKPVGLSKLDHHEFVIENSRSQRPVDFNKRWDRLWQPGEQYDMKMQFHRFACPPSMCPKCQEVNDSDDLLAFCHGCGLEYQNVQAINPPSRDWSHLLPEDADVEIGGDEIPYLIRHPEREPELRIFRPKEELEDELFEGYRRVQIVSQSLALFDVKFPALLLIEDYIRFADLVREVSCGVSPYEEEILELGERAATYIQEKQNNLAAFSSYAHIKRTREVLTKASRQLRRDIDILVRKLCEDPGTKDLIAMIQQSTHDHFPTALPLIYLTRVPGCPRGRMTGYFTGVLIRMVNLAEFAKDPQLRSPRTLSGEKMEWQLLDARPK